MALTREMAITYGAQAVPGTVGNSTLHLTGIHKLRKGPEDAECVFRFVVDAPTEADLATDCAALEVTFTTRRSKLDVTLNANQSFLLDDADNSGFDVTPEISKPGEEDPRFDTNTSRLYEVRVTAGVPAVTADADGLREFEYDVVHTPSRRGSLTVRGVYTATEGGSQAAAVYLAAIDARITTITTALSWTSHLVSESYTPDNKDQVVRFERIYKEIRFNQDASALNNAAIVDPAMVVKLVDTGTESDPAARPLKQVTCEYTTGVDRDQETDLQALFDGTILPWITANMTAVVGSPIAVTSVAFEPNLDEHTIRASVEGFGSAGSKVLSRRVITTDDFQTGKIIRYVWPSDVPDDEGDEQPNPTSAYVYQGPRKLTRTVVTSTETLGALPGGSGQGALGSPRIVLKLGAGSEVSLTKISAPGVEQDTTAVLLSRSAKVQADAKGLVGSQLTIQTKEITEVFEIVNKLTPASSGDTAGGDKNGGVGTTRTRASGGRANTS